MQSKIVRYIINGLYASSGVFLTLLFLVNSRLLEVNTKILIANAVFSFIFYFFMAPQSLTNDFVFKEKEPGKFLFLILSVLVTATICVDLVTSINIVYVIGASVILCVFAYSFLKVVTRFYLKWALGDNKKFFLVSSLLVSLLIIIQFTMFKFSYLQNDFINSMDSYFVYNDMYRDVTYFDIRHPLYTVFSYPLYAFFKTLLSFFRIKPDTCLPIVLQLVNGQLYVFSALLLEKIFKNKYVKYYFICSYPVIINLFYFEKGAIVIFLLLLSIYLIIANSENKDTAVVLSSGASLTSCVIAICYLFSEKKKMVDKLEEMLLLLVRAICIYIVLGRIFVITSFIDLLAYKDTFLVKASIVQKLFSYTHMVSSGFLAPRLVYSDDVLVFDGITDSINFFGTIVLILSVSLLIFGLKKIENKISLIWIAFSFVFVVFMGWDVTESPLFSYYFSWPFLVAAVQGLTSLITKLKASEKMTKVLHGLLISSMLTFNIAYAFYITVYSKDIWLCIQ